MALLSPPAVPSDRFTYDRDANLLVCDASDLGLDFAMGRVYDDACDVGFTVVSATTGQRAVFIGPIQHRDTEGELLWDDFELARESARALPAGCASIRVRIFND